MAGEKDLKKKMEDDVPEQSKQSDQKPLQTSPKVEKAAEPAPAPLMLSFDRWFATLNKPEHHKAGMKAFANTSGKKTLAQWEALFKAY